MPPMYAFHFMSAVTTVLFPEYHVWEYDTSRDGFSLQMDIKYTEQTILYPPLHPPTHIACARFSQSP